MGLEMWFKDDIRNILLGIELASAHLECHYTGPEVQVYREGFRAALASMATSFGITTREPESGVRRPVDQTILPPVPTSLPPYTSARK
jgi:hypothetical protein